MDKLIVFVILLSFSASFAYAENGMESVEDDLIPYEIAEQNDKRQQLLAEIEKRYGETAALLKSLQWQIDQKRRNLTKIRRDIQTKQSEIDKENKELINQVRSAYLMGQQEKLKLLLNQQNPALSNRMIVYYGYINRERLNKLAEIEKTMSRLEELDKQQQTETTLLEQALEQKTAEQTLLNQYRAKRSELLAETSKSFSSVEERLEQIKDSENKLKELITHLHDAPITELDVNQSKDIISTDDTEPANSFTQLKGGFSTLKGKLPWPVKGRIVQNFASLKSRDIQNGVLIAANEGLEVKAVAKGKVAFADWLQNYGFLIIIDHGEGYMTVYAFNQNLHKHKDDSVEAGEVIAAVGQSGGRSQAGLYFGIRKQGLPVDPLEWCR